MYVSERGQYNPQELSVKEYVYAHPSEVPVDGAGLAWGYGHFGNEQGQMGSTSGRVDNGVAMGGGYEVGYGAGGGGGDGGHAGGSGMGWYGADRGHHGTHGHESTKGYEYVLALVRLVLALTTLG